MPTLGRACSMNVTCSLRRSAAVVRRTGICINRLPIRLSSSSAAPKITRSIDGVPSLKEFMAEAGTSDHQQQIQEVDEYVMPTSYDAMTKQLSKTSARRSRTVYIETYGCQMNTSDTEIILSILHKDGFTRVDNAEAADVILTNTCAVREHAETKVWHRLGYFKNIKRKRSRNEAKPVVGVLGCMAERLKTKLLESEKMVDIVAGPDAYRDLPRLISMVSKGEREGEGPGEEGEGEDEGRHAHGVNVQLSQDETYADIVPTRTVSDISAFVSIMRGCNNMCSFCIVPFTRGRERSRPVGTLEDEVRRLRDSGFKEVTLLGQNVNSYFDSASEPLDVYKNTGYNVAKGFNNMYRLRDGDGVRFTELLDRLSLLAPEMRFRFTSPHPKDFPDGLLSLMSERANLCKQLHIPAQSGSTAVLSTMRRGYTREAYLELCQRIRDTLPGAALSSDFISGFCGESEEDHELTLSLIRQVKYEQAFMFAYSRRERTHAAYKLQDDIPEETKQRRLSEVIATFRAGALERNKSEVGCTHTVLVEGFSRRSSQAAPELVGRTDNNKRCVFPASSLPDSADPHSLQIPKAGEYVDVRITKAGPTTLSGAATLRRKLAQS